MKTILTINDISELSNHLHQESKKIVLVGGCFDLLHFGHITLLEKAKKQADVLVVLLESDKRIQFLKGSDRPLHTQMQRAHMLLALKSVDYVVLLPNTMSDNEYAAVVKQLQPAIIATTKGSDSLRYITKQAQENNARVRLVELVKNLSTSRIIDVVTKEL